MGYRQTNLVSDQPGVAAVTDPNLVTPWGMAFAVTSPFWLADEGADVATLYNGNGSPLALVVLVSGAPTGDVFNGSSTSFQIGNSPARFLFATLSGRILGWNGGTSAAVGFIATDGASYTGLTEATVSVGDVLYAADFHNGRIDVINSSFTQIALSGNFTDPNLPAGFSPYNIQLLGGQLYVTYAKPDPATGDAQAGAGLGFVDVFSLDGTLSRRLASAGSLDAPWGLAMAPSTFGQFGGDLLVANHGDGTISAFDPTNGAFLGQLLDPHGNVVKISGLRALDFGNSGPSFDPNTLYFDAGLTGGTDGLFGKLQLVPAVSNDFNSDRTSDILWRDTTSGQVAEWKMSNGAIAANGVSVIGSSPTNWQIAATGDVTGDGTADVIWRDGNTGQVAEWKMSNGAVAANGVSVIGSSPTNWQIAGAGDFNGDGTSDIVWRDGNTGQVADWTMQK